MITTQVGVRHALTLAATHNKPVVPVHHMEAHALMARMPKLNPQPLQFPALLMLVSGGHNMLVGAVAATCWWTSTSKQRCSPGFATAYPRVLQLHVRKER